MNRTTLTSKRVALEGAPDLIPLHPFGSFVGDGVQFLFDEQSLEMVRAALNLTGNPLPLDWHHSTVKVEEGKKETAPAAGFITAYEVIDGYVYGRVDWTLNGEQSVTLEEMNYVSPVIWSDSAGRVLEYHSFALTNRPGTWNQRRIGLESGGIGGTMNEELLKLLGLPANATAEQARVALQALQADAGFGAFVRETIGVERTALESTDTRARILRLAGAEDAAARVATLQAQLETERATAAKARGDAMIEAAITDGRILEPQRAFWQVQVTRDQEAARVALEALPKLVPQTTPEQRKPEERRASLEGNAASISKMLGVSAEELAKTEEK